MKKMNVDPFYTAYIRINSKWIKILNVRHKTIELLQEKLGNKLSDIAFSNIFWISLLRQGKQKKE